MSQSLDKVPTNTYKQTQDLRKLSIFLLIINRVKEEEEEENVTYYKTSSYTLTQNTHNHKHTFSRRILSFLRENKQINKKMRTLIELSFSHISAAETEKKSKKKVTQD